MAWISSTGDKISQSNGAGEAAPARLKSNPAP